MTGSNTEKIQIPLHAQAVFIVLRIGNPLFIAWMHANDKDPLDPYYNAWFLLRRIAAAFDERRHTKLSRQDREDLINALKLAHQLAHDLDVEQAPPVDVCHCAVAEDIRDLALMVAQGAQAGTVAA